VAVKLSKGYMISIYKSWCLL